jgi:hypothetical protein
MSKSSRTTAGIQSLVARSTDSRLILRPQEDEVKKRARPWFSADQLKVQLLQNPQ